MLPPITLVPVTRTTLMPTHSQFLPAAPFSSWPIQCVDPDVGFAWYAGNGVIVTQISGRDGTPRVASVLSDWIDELLELHRTEIVATGGMLGIHDWRRVRNYDSSARNIWFGRMKRRPPNYLRKAVVVISDNPLLKMAIAGGNLVLALASNRIGDIEIASNAYEVLRKYAVTSPVL